MPLTKRLGLFLFLFFLLPLAAKAQTPVFPLPASQGLLANRPAACATVLQEYFATDTSTVYYSTVAGGSCTWVAIPTAAATGITSTGSPANTYLAGFTGATTISGTSGATLDSSGNLVAASVTASSLTTGHCVQASTAGLLTTVSGPCGTSSGTITATGSPANGNLASFSGATSVTNGDLSGDVTTSGTLAATVLKLRGLTLPTLAASTGYLYDTAGTLSLSTSASNFTTGTLPAAQLPTPSASTLGGTESLAAVTHNWIRSISTSGVPAASQPACGDLSDSAPSCNTDTTNAANISSGALPSGRMPVPSASTLGGIESLAVVSHKWINTISTAGVPSATQPAASDLSDTATAGNYLRGNGTSFVSATIQAADVPTLNQNTTGTAANLSGTPALPNGTTATTQSPSDNSTKLATTAYADAEAGVGNPLTTIGDVWGGGVSGAPARIAGGLTGQSLVSNNGGASAFASPGVAGRAVSTSSGDTILCDNGTTLRDRATTVQYTSASPETVTLPQAGSTGCSNNFVFSAFQTGAGTQTITPTTSTINGQSTAAMIQNSWCSVSSPDNSNYLARCANYIKAGAGLTPTFNADGSTTLAVSSGITRTVQLTSNYTNATASFTNVTGGNTIQFSVAASTNYTMQCHLYYQAVSGGGLNIEFTGPASPTNLVYAVTIPVGFTYFVDVVNTSGYGISVGPGEAIVNANTPFDYVITFSLQNGSNAGTVNLLGASYVGGAQAEVQAGSYCRMVTQ